MIRLNYNGVHGSARSWLAAELSTRHKGTLIICSGRARAEELLYDLEFFQRDLPVIHFAAWDTLPFEPVSPHPDVSGTRLACLSRLLANDPCIIVASIEAVAQRVLPPKFIRSLQIALNKNDSVIRSDLEQRLSWLGFHQVSLVQDVGECALRGEVIDLYPGGFSQPVRIEIQQDRILSLRSFDTDSQRTISELDTIELAPVREIVPFNSPDFMDALPNALEKVKARARKLECPPSEIEKRLISLREGSYLPGIELTHQIASTELNSVFDYLPDSALIILEDEVATRHGLERFHEAVTDREQRFAAEHLLIPQASEIFLNDKDLFREISQRNYCKVNSLEISDDLQDSTKHVTLHTASHVELMTRLKTRVGTGQALKPLRSLLDKWRNDDYRIAFVVGSLARAERLQRALLGIDIDAEISEVTGLNWGKARQRAPTVILQGHLSGGFTLQDEKVVFISETEIFPEKSYRKTAAGKTNLKRILNSLSQLQVGDFIVHADFGIGIYKGLRNLEIEGAQGDFLQIEYADSRLLLPIQNISKVQKFFAAEGQNPVIDKLGSSRWTKTKLKVKQAVIALAGDLIKLYATRSVAKGWRFEPAGAEDERFADGFPFNETPDQQRTIDEVLADMADERPMDRLVCGDVGFGKTEVALRAAFKCTQHARQVAVLVPTTILVEQHFATFLQRFADYPVKVAALSRFYSSTQNRETLQQLATGEVDIVIGTHKLLQKDVEFKDLGLLVIDEEHRFGVQQKERLKQMRKQVDVLSLTATPIPRTLHMSLLDVRDTSVISTPPHDRRAIRTYVATYSDSLVRDAILREIQRGGQIFYVHNRVQNIELVSAKLNELVPEARFRFAHGQMSETELEDIMQQFLKREVDVLVCTTIVESGIDVPNANTMIIERADVFGLAQLYQLRGRVGRSNRQAYTYFLVPRFEKLSPDAERRLGVLQSLDELGLGFNLAIRDLEIRGAGNLLGKEQSGNVLSVGFELYTKILKEAVLNLKGEELPEFEAIDPEMKLGINAYIPEYYIPDISERLLLYQRLADLRKASEADDLRAEIEDRFGRLPPEVYNLIEVMRFRSLLREFSIVKAEINHGQLTLSLSKNSPLDIEKISAAEAHADKQLRFTRGLNLILTLDDEEARRAEFIYAKAADVLEKLRAVSKGAGKPGEDSIRYGQH